MNSSKDFCFDFSPKIIRLLGEELIHDKKIAIAELVKNAYDADARSVKVTIGDDELTIRDDGCGMDAEIVKKYWLRPGESSKRNSKERTPKFGRLPLGQKGVGRLGVHRLGKQISVVSKTESGKELHFKIDWKAFDKEDSLEKVPPITVEERDEPESFKNGTTGTELTVRELRELFEKKDIKRLKSDLLKLLSPFPNSTDGNFKIELYDKEGLFEYKEVMDLGTLLKRAFFYYEIAFENGDIVEFNYRFTPPEDPRIKARSWSKQDIEEKLEGFKERHKKQLLKDEEDTYFLADEQQGRSKAEIGKVVFKGYIFETRFSQKLSHSYPLEVKSYLKDNGGIRVYRDGVRVYNYGEEGKDNDILKNLDRKRVKRLGDHIGYNQILAIVELDHENSRALIEKTNREGFIHNGAFLYLRQGLDFCMEVVTYCRKLDRAELDRLFGKEYDMDIGKRGIEDIKREIGKLDIEEKEKGRIVKKLDAFAEDFQQLKDIFLTASNTGLNMTFIVHELDKIIDHLDRKIAEGNLNKIEQVFGHLKNTIAAYRDVIRLDKKKQFCR